MSGSTKPTPTLDKLPIREDDDDDGDDLDDLDDVLDQFSSAPVPATAPPPPPPTAALSSSSSSANRPRTNTLSTHPPTSLPGDSSKHLPNPFGSITEDEEDELSKAFAEELVKGMEGLMKEVTGTGGDGGKSDGEAGKKEGGKEMTEEERTKAFKAAWEAMLIEELGDNAGGVGGEEYTGSGSSAKASSSGTAGGAFQDKIKQAMDKFKESEEKLGGSSSSTNSNQPTPESLEALLQSLSGLGSLGDLGLDDTEKSGTGGEGGADEEKELAGFLETMMSQLLSKDVLYEPLKELGDGFTPYLSSPPTPLSQTDRTRYEKQHACVLRILKIFEKPDYTDDHTEYGKEVVDLMSEMQSHGSPPAEIMGPLPSGLDALNGNTEGCIIS